MHNVLLFIVSVTLVICSMLSTSVQAGRTIKKPGAVLTKLTNPQPTITADDYETEDTESLTKAENVTEIQNSVKVSTKLSVG